MGVSPVVKDGHQPSASKSFCKNCVAKVARTGLHCLLMWHDHDAPCLLVLLGLVLRLLGCIWLYHAVSGFIGRTNTYPVTLGVNAPQAEEEESWDNLQRGQDQWRVLSVPMRARCVWLMCLFCSRKWEELVNSSSQRRACWHVYTLYKLKNSQNMWTIWQYSVKICGLCQKRQGSMTVTPQSCLAGFDRRSIQRVRMYWSNGHRSYCGM